MLSLAMLQKITPEGASGCLEAEQTTKSSLVSLESHFSWLSLLVAMSFINIEVRVRCDHAFLLGMSILKGMSPVYWTLTLD